MKYFAKIREGTWKRFQSALLIGVFVVAIQPGSAFGQADESSMAKDAGIGAVAAVGSLIYGPLKVVYATLGLVFGGMAWGLSGGDSDVMDAVVTPAVRGDYVVTPAILRGEQPLEFIGRRPGYEQPALTAEDEFEDQF